MLDLIVSLEYASDPYVFYSQKNKKCIFYAEYVANLHSI